MKQTDHFGFNKPELTDRLIIGVLNENMDKIDEILSADSYESATEDEIMQVLNTEKGQDAL